MKIKAKSPIFFCLDSLILVIVACVTKAIRTNACPFLIHTPLFTFRFALTRLIAFREFSLGFSSLFPSRSKVSWRER